MEHALQQPPRLARSQILPRHSILIWGRAGAVIDAPTGNIFVATGNGPYDGNTSWGDAVIELNPDATEMLGNYTPTNNAELNERDLDIGSTSPVLLGGDFLAQGGKDALIRLFSIRAMADTAAHEDHELQTVSTPSGTRLFTAPAVRQQGKTWLFAADNGGTAAWTFGAASSLRGGRTTTAAPARWWLAACYTSIVPRADTRLRTSQGNSDRGLECGDGHWNSPIVVDGKIALPEGNANEHSSTGVLDIWSSPAGH